MERYFVDTGKKKTYKLRENTDGAQLYWVQVYQYQDGGFIHSRGMDKLESFEKGLEVCGILAKPASEQDYIEALKEYFSIDKAIRLAFIKQFNLK